MANSVYGYCILLIGKNPSYRIVYKSTLNDALKALPALKNETNGRAEIFRMIDGDTKPIEEDLTYVAD